MQDSAPPADINVRAASYLIAHTVGTCGHCRRATSLLALVVPPDHEVLALDDVEEDAWSRVPGHAFLFHVDYLNESVRSTLRDWAADCFPAAHSAADAGSWANHCSHCGQMLDDQALFCEPGGAFLPLDAAQAARILLVAVDESLVAAAGGYAFEPDGFIAMKRA